MSKCRAKNPGRCRVHGSNNPIDVIINDQLALSNVRASKKLLDEAGDVEEFFEATQLHNHDIKAYNATLEGMEKLSRSIMVPGRLTPDEAMKAKIDLDNAKEYRKEVLAADPVYQESVQKYNDFTKENGVETISLKNKEERKQAMEQLAQIPHMTPLAMKTKNGYIYTYAGNGYSKKPSKLDKFFNPPLFLQGYSGKETNAAAISLESSNMRMYVKDIEELTILKPGSFDKGFGQLENSHVSSNSHENVPHYSNSRWSVKGESFYAEFEGKRSTFDTANGKEFWHSGHISYAFKNTTSIKEIL